ncbi:condensation domain-containing protein, partial [Micromonospora tulbaghiae]|uniref:condensation domain-containing protein n=1 Tax=Micromonospora tulbaghiae TaxID=479978 RepID=UPI00365C16C4
MTQMRREDATTDRVSMLSDVKQELLRRRLRERGSVQRGVPVVSRDEPLLPSFQQEGLWFLDRLDPGQTVYNVPFALRLRGELDVAALRSGLRLLTVRHEALRTRFTTAADGSPRLLIDPAGDGPDLPVIDLSTAHDPFTEAVRHADTEAQRPFDLATGPLLRAALLRLNTDDHVLLLSLHHAVTDGWSVSILTHELSEAYQALTQGRQPQLPPLTVQPADV